MIYIIASLLSYVAASLVPASNLRKTPYNERAHMHWVWNHNSKSNQIDATNLVNDYIAHDIPVGGLDIDSGWSTYYNNFEYDPAKFSDMKGMLDYMHSLDVKVIFWATSMVNIDDPNYAYALEHNYFVRTPRGEVRPIHWWHGDGALLDYTNPEATAWWHSLLDKILDLGADGFKCDGTDPFVLEYLKPMGYNNETITYREYADAYYRDFLFYTQEVRGQGVTWARPVDCFDNIDAGCLAFAPHDVMFSGWVGDDESSWQGLRSCIRKSIFSAWDGYAAYGCDVGGYNTDDTALGRSKEVFLRSAQLNALFPLMENGGGGEHRPWKFDEAEGLDSTETTDIYRNFVELHETLRPFWMTAGSRAFETSTSIINPIAVRRSDNPYRHPEPDTLAFELDHTLFVEPIAMDTGGFVLVEFPGEGTDEWVDYWNPKLLSFAGGQKVVRHYGLDSYPLFVKRGAILPTKTKAEEQMTGDGGLFEAAMMTSHLEFVVYGVRDGQVTGEARNELDGGVAATYQYSETDMSFVATISAYDDIISFKMVGVDKPGTMQVECSEARIDLPCSLSWYIGNEIYVIVPDASAGVVITMTGLESIN